MNRRVYLATIPRTELQLALQPTVCAANKKAPINSARTRILQNSPHKRELDHCVRPSAGERAGHRRR